MKRSEYNLGMALTTGSAVAWSLAGYFTRLIPYDTWTLLAWRGIFGALGIALIMIGLERGAAFRNLTRMGWGGWSFVAASSAAMILFIMSLKNTTVAHVSVIYATVPFIAAGLGWLVLRERPSESALVASLVAFVGVALMVGFGTGGNAYGDLLAFAMTIAMAAMMVIARRFRHLPVLASACVSALVSGLICWPLGAPLSVSGHDFVLFALFGMVNSALGLGLFTLGARYLPPIETALIGALDAPLAPLWVWLAFGETPDATTIIGGVVVMAATVGHILLAASRRPAVADAVSGSGPIAEPDIPLDQPLAVVLAEVDVDRRAGDDNGQTAGYPAA